MERQNHQEGSRVKTGLVLWFIRRGNRGVISWLFPEEIRLVIFWKESLTVTFPECNQSNSRQALWKHSWCCLGDMLGDIHEIVWGISLETFLNLSEEWVWKHSWIGLLKQSGNSHEFAWKVSWEFFHYLRMFSSLKSYKSKSISYRHSNPIRRKSHQTSS